ncbi:unnamed protein product [Diatraea saccharalis]|uniref:Uncharacterized protein n=1 Tax=Diatraea saccharalis TaxID=40085 RepID=A0A9N9R705_9NEOP|nr:unnamed protein product [Diatraea saccharalis]
MSDTEKRENTRSTNSFDKIGMKMKTDNESFDISDSSSDSIHLAGMKSPFRWESEQETSDNLYGLNPRFIESIGIKLPLDKWVHVSNRQEWCGPTPDEYLSTR